MPIEAIALKDFSISEIGDCALRHPHSVSSWPHLSQRSSSMASEPPPHDAEYAAAQLAQIRKYAHLYPPVERSGPSKLVNNVVVASVVNDVVAGSLADVLSAAAVASAAPPPAAAAAAAGCAAGAASETPVSGTIEQTSVLRYGLEVREFEWEDDVRLRF